MGGRAPSPAEVWLYRVFDGRTDELLYVGVSQDPTYRLRSHKGKAWWPSDVLVTMQGPFSREDALEREAWAIRSESPVVNKSGKTNILKARVS